MIKLVRVDHRLLHGQVIFSWTKQVGTNYIIVADDKVPNDPISMMALSIAKPVDCELSIIPFSQLRKLVDENASKNIMIIVKGPAEALQLAKELPEVTEINYGGVAKKAGYVKPETPMIHIGFGTMNGKDGKPFKTRQGGVMRLENLIKDTQDEMYKKIKEGRDMEDAEARKVADVVAISALKYGDLSNQASKDYVFDIDRFTSFEGDTGPYILYTIVRIKSILNKYKEQGGDLTAVKLQQPGNASEKELAMELAQFNTMIATAGEELAPHKVCAYIYDLANAFNHFYHETKILGEENEERKQGLVALLVLTRDILETCIDMLGFEAPEKM